MPVPMLRFKEFRANSNFKTVCLEHAGIEVIDGDRGINYPSGSDFSNNGFCLFLNAKNVTKNGFSFDEKMFISQDKDSSMSKGKLVEEDLVLTTRGSIGNLAYFNESVPFQHLRINSGMVLLRAKNSELLPQYLYQQLNSPSRNKNIEFLAFGSAQPQLTVSGIKSLKLNIPSVEEQAKIANFLTAVDDKISQLTKKHELLNLYKKGVMQKIFSQELRFRDDDGRVFAEWEEKKLGEIANLFKGKGLSKADIDKDGAHPCIRYGELYTEYGEAIRSIQSHTNLDPKDHVVSAINDVIIPASGETQIDIATASCVLVGGVILGGDLNIIRATSNQAFNGIFLSYFLNTKKKLEIAKLAQGNSVVHLYASQLKGLMIYLPKLDEQTKIANFLTAIDDKITNVKSQLEAAKEYKQGLLQQMFV